MGRAILAMVKNDPENERLSVPVEYARAEWSIEHAPSATALKALSVVLAHAGGDLSAQVEVPLSALRAVPRVGGMSAAQVADMIRSLMMASVASSFEVLPGVIRDRFGPIVSYAELDRRGGDLLALTVQFGPAFVKLAEESDLYALLDRALLVGLKSRYSVLLYQYLASHWRKRDQRFMRMTIAEWRKVFALSADVMPDFRDFNRRVLVPAITEVSAVSPFDLSVERAYEGRAVVALSVSWRAKPKDGPADVMTLPAKRVGRPSKAAASAVAKSEKSPAERLAMWAARVRDGGKRPMSSDVTPTLARELLHGGYVTAEELRARGIVF